MITFVVGDLTEQRVDAIVNAANEALVAAAGVCGAIRRAGGDEIFDECARLGSCTTGDAKATGAGRLPARYVIHAVGPVWHGGSHGEAELLASAYRRALEVGNELGCRTVAFPAHPSQSPQYGNSRTGSTRFASSSSTTGCATSSPAPPRSCSP